MLSLILQESTALISAIRSALAGYEAYKQEIMVYAADADVGQQHAVMLNMQLVSIATQVHKKHHDNGLVAQWQTCQLFCPNFYLLATVHLVSGDANLYILLLCTS